MWRFHRNKANREEASNAKAEAEDISRRIDDEIKTDLDRAHILRTVRERDSLSEKFDAAFRDRSRRARGAN